MGGGKQTIPPDWHAIVALMALTTGLSYCFSAGRYQSIAAGVSGIIALASMLLLKSSSDSDVEMVNSGNLFTLEYKVGFWGTCMASCAGVVLAFMRVKSAGSQSAAQQQTEIAPSDLV